MRLPHVFINLAGITISSGLVIELDIISDDKLWEVKLLSPKMSPNMVFISVFVCGGRCSTNKALVEALPLIS